MKKKIIFALTIALALVILVATIVGLWHQTFLTIFAWIAIVKISEHWKEVTLFLITTAISIAGGAVLLYLIHLIFTGEFIIYMDSLWSIGFLFTSIYALGLLIEEDQRAPYIWLWKQMKKLRRIGGTIQVC